MIRLARCFIIAVAILLANVPFVIAAEQVDLLLVLSADVSRSVDYQKFQLYREGYHKALTDPRVVKAITSGAYGRVAVNFVEWAGYGQQKVVVDWTLVDGTESAGFFAEQVLKAPRSFADRTSISGAIEFSMVQLERAPYESTRRTVDVTGDGTNNSGPDVVYARDRALAKGVTINGLVILTDTPRVWNSDHTNPPGGLEEYYRRNVIGGPGAFVLAAENFGTFGQAIIKKLIAEIAMLPLPQQGYIRR